MGIDRYFGMHFTETCVYIAEAYVGRDNHLQWDMMEQANYELEPEWLPLFKDAIPNLYDNEENVYGFAALPSIWRGFRRERFLRFNLRFFERAVDGKLTDDDRRKLIGLFRYCQVYHIRPQSDEKLIATLVVEQLTERQQHALQTFLGQIARQARSEFIDVIDPEEACLRYLWYESAQHNLNVERKMVLLIDLGYGRTWMIPWDHCQTVGRSVRGPGMIEIDRAVTRYAGAKGLGKTVGTDELFLYAQRARRAFDPDQPSVKIIDAELDAQIYLEIIKEQVSEIARRLECFLRDTNGRMNRVEEILLMGEGAAFPPVVEAMQMARIDVPMRALPQPTYAAARGAASKSWRANNRESEIR